MSIPRFVLLLLLIAGLASAQAQTAPAPAAQQDFPTWLATTDGQWQAVYKRDVTDLHDTTAGNIKRQYQTALESAIDRASTANDLKGALALRDALKRFTETGALPDQDEASDSVTLKQLRAAIRAQFAKLEGETAVRAKALHGKYDQVLAQAQTQLTQGKRLDDALLVQKKRDAVAAAWIKPAVSVPDKPNPSTAVTAVTTPKAGPPKPALSVPATPEVKSANDAQLTKLTRTMWTWETVMGKNTIKFAKDGTCVHTRFNGTYEINKDDSVIVNLPTRKTTLLFDFNKGTYSGYDSVLQQKITGKRTSGK